MHKIARIVLFFACFAGFTQAAHSQVKTISSVATRYFSVAPIGSEKSSYRVIDAAGKAFQDLGFKRLGKDRSCWSGASANSMVFIYINSSEWPPDYGTRVYLVSASSTRDEAEWAAQSLFVKINSNLKDAPPPPPAIRGRCPVQWCQIRERDSRNVNPEKTVDDLMRSQGWVETGRSGTDRVAVKDRMKLLARWERRPYNQLRYFVFTFIESDSDKSAANAVTLFANGLMR